MIVVGSNMGVSRMTKEHLGIALALKIPLFVILTKIDIAPDNVLEDTISTLKKLLKSAATGRKIIIVNKGDEIEKYSEPIANDLLIPIFQISNVTG
jgi:GTPase